MNLQRRFSPEDTSHFTCEMSQARALRELRRPTWFKYRSPELLARPACLRCGSARSGGYSLSIHSVTFSWPGCGAHTRRRLAVIKACHAQTQFYLTRDHFLANAAEVDRLHAEYELHFVLQLVVGELRSLRRQVRQVKLWSVIAVEETHFQERRDRRIAVV